MAAPIATLILPVESQVRELDAKLLLACFAAERGFSVVLGSRAFVHYKVSSFPRGVYLAKSMRSLSDRMFSILRKLGHEIVAWDEEGLVRFPDPEYYRRRLSAKAVSQVSMLLAWGPDDARVLREFPGYCGCPVRITGNPRIDLMRPALRDYFRRDVDRIRGEFGDIVLVNTNFGGLNHFFPKLSYLKRALESDGDDRTDRFTRELAAHRQAVFEHFQKLVPTLCDTLPDDMVIVRPHPSENHELWKELVRGRKNVRVVNEGNVLPWLMAAKVLVHNGCTTAVEAALLGTPAVAYQPVMSKECDLHLPNALSHRVFHLEALQKTVRSIVAGELAAMDERERRRILAEHVASLEGRLAADRMVDELKNSGYGQGRPSPNGIATYLQGWVHLQLRTAVKLFNMRRPGHRNNAAFHAHRFPGISVDELRERIDRFGRVLHRFQTVRVRQLSRHIFQIDG